MRRAAPWIVCLASLALNVHLVWIGVSWVGRTFPGFFVVEPFGTVMPFMPVGWTGAQAGLHNNDRVLRYNGTPFQGAKALYDYTGRLPEGTVVKYAIQSPRGVTKEVSVSTMRLGWPAFAHLFLIAGVLGSSLLLFGLTVHSLKPEHPASTAFLALGITGNALFVSQVGGLVSEAFWGQFLMVLALPFFAASLVHLDLVFPVVRPMIRQRPWVAAVPYALVLVALLLLLAFSHAGGEYLHVRPQPLASLYGRFGIALCLLPAIALVWSSLSYYKHADTPLARQRARLTLAGVIACFPVAVSLAVISEAGLLNVSLGLLGVPVWAFLGIIGYAIVRYRLLDIRVAIGRSALKIGVVALVTLAYTGIAAALGSTLSAAGFPDSPLAAAAFLGVAMLGYAVVHERLSAWGERTFFPERQHMLQELGQLAERLGLLTNRNEVAEAVVGAVRSLLGVRQIHLLVKDDSEEEDRFRSFCAAEGSEQITVPCIRGDDSIVTLLRSTKTELFRDELIEDRRLEAMRDAGIAAFDKLRARVLIPCLHKEELTAILALGAKRRDEAYTAQDINWLRAVAAQAASALTRASLIGERYMRQLVAAELKRFFSPAIAEDMVERGLSDEYRRREVSIVVTDLRGFTNFAERAEPEDLMNLLREYHSVVGPLVFSHGGTITQFSGDGIVIIFGDPAEMADHATHAVDTALTARRALTPLFERWAAKGYSLGLGIGISTGFATCGYVGFKGRREYTALGKVVNIAARLCDAAERGQILVTLRTTSAADTRFKWESVGPLRLKGIADSLPAFNLIGAGTDS